MLSEKAYWLPPHVRACATANGTVLLDLRRNRYFGVGRKETRVLSSLAANCEGQSVLGLLGYVLADKPADLPSLPLYRCNAGAHHFDSVTTGCEGQTVEFQYGWVLN